MKTLQAAIRPTTFIESDKLKKHLGIDLTVASETFQWTGSFKFRAAYNLALNVPNQEIVTASSGNFGQALACACQMLGKKCVVVMPETSAKVKIEAVKGYGATVDLVDTKKVGREERVRQILETMPEAYKASAYDDAMVIDGNSTLGKEVANYKSFDAVIVPVGGGGLSSGIVKGLAEIGSRIKTVGAEPQLGNDASRSLQAGELVANEVEPMTIADGARTISLGQQNWAILKDGLTGIIEVTEEKIAEAMRLYFGLANLKCEPTGAVSLGAILENPDNFGDQKVCLIVSGGNVDTEVYRNIIA
jgi:threonine dehydratase